MDDICYIHYVEITECVTEKSVTLFIRQIILYEEIFGVNSSVFCI